MALSTDTVKPREIKASVLHGVGDLRTETRTLAPPSPTELQIAVTHTGLCGSDLHYYHHFSIGATPVRSPLSLGHESAGIVVALGTEVTSFSVGDRVALEVGQPCGECGRCEEGRYNICKGMRFRSSAKAWPHAQGTLQERINHPARWCYKLPDTVSSPLGALVEPLSVGIHASRRANLAPDSNVLVFGAGAVGLLVAAVAKIKGASTVIIADIELGRVEFAVKNNFAHRGVVLPLRRGKSEQEELNIAKETAGLISRERKVGGEEDVGEVDAVFECTGQQSCVQAAIYCCRPGAKVLLIGIPSKSTQTLPLSDAALREVDLLGVFRYADTYPQGIEMVGRKGSGPDYPDFESLVTHRYQGLENVEEAFRMAAKKTGEGELVIKVMVEVDAGI